LSVAERFELLSFTLHSGYGIAACILRFSFPCLLLPDPIFSSSLPGCLSFSQRSPLLSRLGRILRAVCAVRCAGHGVASGDRRGTAGTSGCTTGTANAAAYGCLRVAHRAPSCAYGVLPFAGRFLLPFVSLRFERDASAVTPASAFSGFATVPCSPLWRFWDGEDYWTTGTTTAAVPTTAQRTCGMAHLPPLQGETCRQLPLRRLPQRCCSADGRKQAFGGRTFVWRLLRTNRRRAVFATTVVAFFWYFLLASSASATPSTCIRTAKHESGRASGGVKTATGADWRLVTVADIDVA